MSLQRREEEQDQRCHYDFVPMRLNRTLGTFSPKFIFEAREEAERGGEFSVNPLLIPLSLRFPNKITVAT